MSKLFSVQLPSGRFASLTITPVVSQSGLTALEAYAQNLPGPDGDLLRGTIIPALSAFPMTLRPATFTPPNPAPNTTYVTSEQWLVVATPDAETAHFRLVDHERATPFTAQANTWGWKEASVLHAHADLIKKHAALCTQQPYIDLSALAAAARRYDQLCSGAISVREPDVEHDVATGVSYAIYSPEMGGYATPQWSFGPLASARLFESIESLKKNEGTQRHARIMGLQVVQVDLAIAQVTETLGPPNTDVDNAMSDALALVQRRALEQALHMADVDALRRRLSELEGTPAAPPRKKM